MNLKYITVTWLLKMEKSVWATLTFSVDLLASSFCVHTHADIWRSINRINFQFAPPNKVVMTDVNWFQSLGQFTAAHFLDLNQYSYDVNNMKFDLNASAKVKFIAND